ncbi:lipase 4 [Podospora fimiseda]|uniref:Lipase 4 n=1 Tax=Podospora fimiseda TaxID=252190 RepID=A0AAN6YLH7_9PEZI|nr:lipase 4 [Podospora fimiseda]
MQLAFLALLPVALGLSHPPPTAKTRNGTYLGRHLPEFKQDLFLNIPFARSPRLANPIPWNETWKGTRSAEWYGSICHNLASEAEITRANVTGMSEECLNLNIIRPSPESIKKHKPKLLPVVVWLYGGGFVDGFGADLNSNLSYIIQDSVALGTPILGITLNYRLGFLGFPGGGEIAREGVTNLGLKDQRQALLWIQENIAAFNGDPKKVTIWGQSAGSQSIAHQLLAYNGSASNSKLFHQGILISSGVGIGNSHSPTRSDPINGFNTILRKTNCSDLACLRQIPIEKLWDASRVNTLATWRPMVDNGFIGQPPTLQLQAGIFPKDISFLTGTASDEGFVFANLAPSLNTEQELFDIFKQFMTFARDETIQKVLELYPDEGPLPPYALPYSKTNDKFCQELSSAGLPCGAQYRRLASILGDLGFISGRRLLCQTFAKHGMTAYSYHFDTWPMSFPVDTHPNRKPGFANHGADYSYWFAWGPGHEIYGNNPAVIESSEGHRRLREGMSRMLIGFIYGGDPNIGRVKGFPEWPKYSVENPRNIVFNATAEPDRLNVHLEKDDWREEAMALWWTYPLELDLASPTE